MARTKRTMMIRVSWLMTLLFVCGVSVFAQQSAPAGDFVLTVGGEVEKPLNLSLSDLSKFPRRSVQAKDHDGKEHRYEGIEVREILRQAGVKQGKELRGKALALYLLVEATDNYQAVFALPELDAEFTDRVILLVDKQDGQALPSTHGPYRIVVPDEKIFARWVRQVKSLTILRAGK
jgi:DMSO/TMAO reductase YedYZ molybdopterin-dependent catalytic subunit